MQLADICDAVIAVQCVAGRVQAMPVAWPGMGTLLYTVADVWEDGEVNSVAQCCGKCAMTRKYLGAEDLLVSCQAYDEGSSFPCELCGEMIEASYGNPFEE